MMKIFNRVKPFYSLEQSPCDVVCGECGGILSPSDERIIKTEKGILSTEWQRQHYCLECAIKMLSGEKTYSLRKAIGAQFDWNYLDKLVAETNKKNGHDLVMRRIQ